MAKKKKTSKPLKKKTNDVMPVVCNGLIDVKISGGQHDGETLTIDTIATRLVMDEVEQRHLDAKGNVKVTSAFTMDMATALTKSGFVKDCTPTMAIGLWHAVSKAWEVVKKNMRI